MRFHQASGSKLRPAVVLLDVGDEDFVAAPITSRQHNSTFDFVIRDWNLAGLNVPSTVRAHKLAVVAKVDIVRRLGVLPEVDGGELRKLLCDMFCR